MCIRSKLLKPRNLQSQNSEAVLSFMPGLQTRDDESHGEQAAKKAPCKHSLGGLGLSRLRWSCFFLDVCSCFGMFTALELLIVGCSRLWNCFGMFKALESIFLDSGMGSFWIQAWDLSGFRHGIFLETGMGFFL